MRFGNVTLIGIIGALMFWAGLVVIVSGCGGFSVGEPHRTVDSRIVNLDGEVESKDAEGCVEDSPDAARSSLSRRIQAALIEASAIVIDGDLDDWDGLYWVETSVNVPGGSKAKAVALSVAPMDNEVRFALTVGRGGEKVFDVWDEVWLFVSSSGAMDEWIEIRMDEVSAALWECKRGARMKLKGGNSLVRRMVGNGLEGVIDLHAVLSGAPRLLSPDMLRPNGDSWFRVDTTLRGAARGGRGGVSEADSLGPSVASFRLCSESSRDRECIDGSSDERRVVSPFFLDGKWMVVAGPNDWPFHSNMVAYDFNIMDMRGASQSDDRSGNEKQAYSWGADVLAPCDAIILEESSAEADHGVSKSEWMPGELRANGGNVIVGEGRFKWKMAHLQWKSIAWRRGDAVSEGDVVAKVGNSGVSTGPHLHVEVYERGGETAVPLALAKVVVGLNSSLDDPWEVPWAEWLVQPGFFVRSWDDRR